METSIMMADLRNGMIPVGKCEEEGDNVDRDKASETNRKEADEAYRRLVLTELQRNGEDMAALREALDKLNTKMDHVDDRVSSVIKSQLDDRSEFLTLIGEIKKNNELNAGRIQQNTDTIVSLRETVRKHIYDTDAEEQIKLAEKNTQKSQRVSIISVTIGGMSFIFGVIMAFLQFAGG
ncbi:MAG: hypothetical protein PVJ39_04790 [Gammaproteobacteria bacterium]|jgi:hypothetical protein